MRHGRPKPVLPPYRGFARTTLVAFATGLAAMLLAALPTYSLAATKLHQRDLKLARDYAACVIDRYPGTPPAAEADAWASGLVEQGTLRPTPIPSWRVWRAAHPRRASPTTA